MGKLIEGTDYYVVPMGEWEDRLKEAQAKWRDQSIPAFLEFCEEVHAFRRKCEDDKTQGGTTFTKLGTEWLRVTDSQLCHWDRVGERASELRGAPRSLPSSEDSIYRIAALDDISFRKALPRLRADMPQTEVRALIKEINPPPELTAKEHEKKIERKRQRLYKDFMALPDKHRFILGRAIYAHLQAQGWEP